MTDPRDKVGPKHGPLTPGGGVTRASTQPGAIREVNRTPITKPESWEGGDSYTDVNAQQADTRKTPPHGIAVSRTDMRKTPPHGIAVSRTASDSDLLQMTARRAGETKNIAIDTKTAATTTLDHVNRLEKAVLDMLTRQQEALEKIAFGEADEKREAREHSREMWKFWSIRIALAIAAVWAVVSVILLARYQ